MKILLDYVFPITTVVPTPAASTAFLKQVALVVKPKAGQAEGVFETISMQQVAARTDNQEAANFFAAGMNRVFLIVSNDLDLDAAIQSKANAFFTIVVSSDFAKGEVGGVSSSLVKGNLTFRAKNPGTDGDDITVAFVDGATAGNETVAVTDKAILVSMDDGASQAGALKALIESLPEAVNLVSVEVATGQSATPQAAFVSAPLAGGVEAIGLGAYKGVTAFASDDREFLKAQAKIDNRVAFYSKSTTGAKNLVFAIGSLLANPNNWYNQQFIQMPVDDEVNTLPMANQLFDDRISFAIADDEFGVRLALFAVGGKAIVAPYILKNLRIDVQSRALQWISLNQPDYTLTEATLLESDLQENVINSYIAQKKITSGKIEITLEQANFVASGEIETPQPKALWRVFTEMRETL